MKHLIILTLASGIAFSSSVHADIVCTRSVGDIARVVINSGRSSATVTCTKGSSGTFSLTQADFRLKINDGGQLSAIHFNSERFYVGQSATVITHQCGIGLMICNGDGI